MRRKTSLSRKSDRLFGKIFRLGQKLGFHVVRNHFYGPVPDTRRLPERLWEVRAELPGVDLNEAGQLQMLDRFAQRYRDEYERFPSGGDGSGRRYQLDNPMFGKVDAEILWCMIRDRRPRRIIEVGGGNSTLLSAEAILKNQANDPSYRCDLVTIEPHPSEALRAGFPGLGELIVSEVQRVPLARFAALEAGDILFIDSSHVLKIGSDTQYELLEVMPRLAPGVLVHIHDIFLPGEYPRHLVVDWNRFWTEQYVLQAFLAFNAHFKVLWGSSCMHLRYPERLAAAFPSYLREGWPTGLPPSSFWMRRVS